MDYGEDDFLRRREMDANIEYNAYRKLFDGKMPTEMEFFELYCMSSLKDIQKPEDIQDKRLDKFAKESARKRCLEVLTQYAKVVGKKSLSPEVCAYACIEKMFAKRKKQVSQEGIRALQYFMQDRGITQDDLGVMDFFS